MVKKKKSNGRKTVKKKSGDEERTLSTSGEWTTAESDVIDNESQLRVMARVIAEPRKCLRTCAARDGLREHETSQMPFAPSFHLVVVLSQPPRALTSPLHLHLLSTPSAPHATMFARSCAPLRAMPLASRFLPTKIHFPSGFGLSTSQSCHSTTRH